MNEVLLPILRHEDEFTYATACHMVVDVSTGRVRKARRRCMVPDHSQ